MLFKWESKYETNVCYLCENQNTKPMHAICVLQKHMKGSRTSFPLFQRKREQHFTKKIRTRKKENV